MAKPTLYRVTARQPASVFYALPGKMPGLVRSLTRAGLSVTVKVEKGKPPPGAKLAP